MPYVPSHSHISINEHKKLIWQKLKSVKWKKEYVLRLRERPIDHSYNYALCAAKK